MSDCDGLSNVRQKSLQNHIDIALLVGPCHLPSKTFIQYIQAKFGPERDRAFIFLAAIATWFLPRLTYRPLMTTLPTSPRTSSPSKNVQF